MTIRPFLETIKGPRIDRFLVLHSITVLNPFLRFNLMDPEPFSLVYQLCLQDSFGHRTEVAGQLCVVGGLL